MGKKNSSSARDKNSFKRFFVNMGRVLQISWRVSPVTFSFKILLSLIFGVMPLATAYLGGQLINGVVDYLSGKGTTDPRDLYMILIGLSGLYLGRRGLTAINSYLDELGGYQFELFINQTLFRQILRLDHTYYDNKTFNDQLTKVRQHMYSIERCVDNIISIFADAVQMVTTGVAVALLNIWLLPIVLVSFLPTLWVELSANKKRWKLWDILSTTNRLQHFSAGQVLNTQDITETKLYNLGTFFAERWKGYFNEGTKQRVRLSASTRNQTTLASFFETGVNWAIQVWLLSRVLQNSGFGIGDFQFYRQIIGDFGNASSGVLHSLQRLLDDSQYIEDYFKLMEYEPRITFSPDAYKLPSAVPDIEFRNVSFKYPDSDRLILKNVSFTIPSGEDVAIVGENGAGKSTLIKLLLRFYDPTKGQILVGGQDLKTLDLFTWYDQIGALFQDFPTYNFYSVKDNIIIGRPEVATDKKGLLQASRAAKAHDFILQYPKKYQQPLSPHIDGGLRPSGGQWQRIALARTFFRNANVLILDEPTSAIDAKGEFEVFQTIAQTQKDKTTIIISHRFSTVRKAHKIYVLENGKIIEQGTHHELLTHKKGKYKEMFELQAEGYR